MAGEDTTQRGITDTTVVDTDIHVMGAMGFGELERYLDEPHRSHVRNPRSFRSR